MNWLKEIADASSVEQLLGLVNQYLLSVPEEHWSRIPRSDRPTLVASAAELHDWHRRLCDHMGAATTPNIRLQDLCVLFVRASAREIEIAQEAASCSNDGAGARRERETG